MIVKLINNPFDIDDVVEKNIEYDYECCADVLKKHFDNALSKDFRVICSGKQVEMNDIPSMHDELIFVRDIRGGKGGILNFVLGAILIVAGYFTLGSSSYIGMAMISAGAGMIVGGLAQLFAPKVDVDNMDNTPTYSWDGIQNIVGEGNVVPVVYGVHRVGGAFIEGYVDGINTNGTSEFNYLYLVSALSEGEIHRIHEETIKIAGNPLWTYMTDVEELKSVFINPKTKETECIDGVITSSLKRLHDETIGDFYREGGRTVDVGSTDRGSSGGGFGGRDGNEAQGGNVD